MVGKVCTNTGLLATGRGSHWALGEPASQAHREGLWAVAGMEGGEASGAREAMEGVWAHLQKMDTFWS